MENGPLPVLRREVILLIGVRNKGVVGGHHSHVQMHKVAEERRLVGADISLGEFIVPVRFDVPVREYVPGVVLFSASNFNLLETPLREVHVTGTEIATETSMSQAECGCKGPELAVVFVCGVTDNLDGPVVFFITDGHVTVA